MNVLVVGSSKIDLFFELENKSSVAVSDKNIALKLGDKIPVGVKKIALGGDGANISVGLKRLGIPTRFYTFLGNDFFSKEMEETIKKEEVDLIVRKNGDKSSLSLIFCLNSDRIIFTSHEVRDHKFLYEADKLPDFIYLTSVGDQWQDFYKQVLNFCKQYKIPLGFTPGSVQLKEKSGILFDVFKSSKIVFLNVDEAKKILDFQNIPHTEDIKDILGKMKLMGIETVSLTNGLEGSWAIDSSNKFYFIRSFGQKAPEITGAGDAYTSGFLSFYLQGLETKECMRRGALNAGSVVSKIGAQEGLLSKEEMERISSENKDFVAEEI